MYGYADRKELALIGSGLAPAQADGTPSGLAAATAALETANVNYAVVGVYEPETLAPSLASHFWFWTRGF